MSIEREAKNAATDYWRGIISRCGESSFIGDNVTNVRPYGSDYLNVIELKDYEIEVESKQLTDADKLNGIEWQGVTQINVKTARYNAGDNFQGEWFDVNDRGFPKYLRLEARRFMSKRKGEWVFGSNGWGVSIDCSKMKRASST
jgi:hypothetical protein